MGRVSASFVLQAIAIGILLTAATASAADESWIRAQSANFQVIGNAPEPDLRRAAARLEQFREVFTRLFPGFRFNSPIPTRVIVFRERKMFERFTRVEWAAGFFLPGEDVNHIVLPIDGREAENLSTIFHEYTHFLLDNSLGRAKIPPWLNEGIAEYFENFAISDDRRVTVGAANAGHLRLLARSKLIPPETHFGTDYYTLHKQTRETAQLFYAQSWLLVHFMIHGGQTIRRPQFDRFVEMLANGSRLKDAFSEALQIDPADLENLLRDYAGRKKFGAESFIYPQGQSSDSAVTVSPVTVSEARAIQADLLVHSDRLADAEAILIEALAADPDSAHANAVLGVVKMRQRKFYEARERLEKAILAKDANYLTFFNHAFAISREGVTEYGFASGYTPGDAEKMRRSLARAIELNPQFAESYNLFAFIAIVRNERLDEAVELIRKALAIAPGNQWYAIRLSELLMRKEDFAAARKLAIDVRQSASTDQLRIYAENTLRTINSLESQLRSIAEEERRERQAEVTDEPLSDDEIKRRREIAMLESLNMTLRRTRSGETRILGRLTMIDCRNDELFFGVVNAAGNSRFRAESLEVVRLISYDPKFVNAEFGCGPVRKENLAVFTYRVSPDNKQISGELVSIEFVPPNFRFLKE